MPAPMGNGMQRIVKPSKFQMILSPANVQRTNITGKKSFDFKVFSYLEFEIYECRN